MEKTADVFFIPECDMAYAIEREVWETVFWEGDTEVGRAIYGSRDEAERAAAEWEMK